MDIPLFDVQAGFGGLQPGKADVFSPGDLLGEMDRVSIDRAAVRIFPDTLDKDVPLSNRLLYEAHRKHPRLLPCPIVVPAGAFGYAPEADQVAEAIDNGAAAARIRPAVDQWILADWVCGRLMDVLVERKLPLFCLAAAVPLGQVGELARLCPELTIIIAGVEFRSANVLMPLLETFGNTLLSIGSNYTQHRGIETLVERFGAERLLFGTGLPTAQPMTAITQLMYAEISDEQKWLIGSQNLERLIGGIRR